MMARCKTGVLTHMGGVTSNDDDVEIAYLGT
jgi:hypothetical protein